MSGNKVISELYTVAAIQGAAGAGNIFKALF